jgi:acyl-CoA thioester hydrolase
MDASKFPVTLHIRLDWSEMDLFGHINNVSFFKYIQAARVNYWETVGIDSQNTEGIGQMLLSASCNFKSPLFYPGNIIIRSSVTFIRNTSFGIAHVILNENGEVAAEAEDVIVMYDFDNHKKVNIPDAIRMKIEEVEKKKYS